MRGLVSLVLLERVCQQRPALLSQINLFAGTSIGGILALALAAGMEPTAIRQAFLEQGVSVFLDSARPPGVTSVAHYGNVQLERFLTELFGRKRLGDLPRPVIVSAFNLDTGRTHPGRLRRKQPKFFHNLPGPDADRDVPVVDVALATSAVPIFFPIYKGHIDGGVMAVNPSMCAVAQALEPQSGGQRLDDLVLLSLSTGHSANFTDVSDGGDWGWDQWSREYLIMDVMLGNDAPIVDFQCRQLLGPRYCRIDPVIKQVVKFNDTFALPTLLMAAMQADLGDSAEWLRTYFP